jgi:hypothetical protein
MSKLTLLAFFPWIQRTSSAGRLGDENRMLICIRNKPETLPLKKIKSVGCGSVLRRLHRPASTHTCTEMPLKP